MVQARQLRKFHEDAHYASALFKYEKPFACKYKDFTTFVCMDDKHACKVGEPKCPVAAVDRGKRVIVGLNQSLEVSDHDHTKLSIIPSVILKVDLPDSTDGSFYRGEVCVSIKEHCFQPSTPIRHACELKAFLNSIDDRKEILCLYTDGGPDHRTTYYSVKMALISLFLAMDKDMVLAVRTPLYHSWKDPAERIMSILNLGLQGIGLVRNEMKEEIEKEFVRCKGLKSVRKLAEKNEEVKTEVLNSVKNTVDLTKTLFQRLKLKDKPFHTQDPPTDEEMKVLWDEILKIDNSLEQSDTTAAKVSKKQKFMEFLKTHCFERHYVFGVRKCGAEACSVCKPPRLPEEIFSALHFLPDPTPNNDHYLPFEEVYGTVTSEKFTPLKTVAQKDPEMPFSATAQTAKNVKEVVVCEECDKRRLLHSKRKLNKLQKVMLTSALDILTYTCGSSFADEIEDDNDLDEDNVSIYSVVCAKKFKLHKPH